MKTTCLNLDTMGVCASALCTAHCLLFPLLVAAVPLLTTESAEIQAAQPASGGPDGALLPMVAPGAACAIESCCAVIPEPAAVQETAATPACCDSTSGFWIHAGFLGIAFPLGLFTWLRGFKHHGRAAIPALGATGLAVLCLALLLGSEGLGADGERIMTIGGSGFLAGAHLWNRRQCRCRGASQESSAAVAHRSTTCPANQ